MGDVVEIGSRRPMGVVSEELVLRPSVREFARALEASLRQAEEGTKPQAWHAEEPIWLFHFVFGSMTDLYDALHGRGDPSEKAGSLACFAFMIWDKMRCETKS